MSLFASRSDTVSSSGPASPPVPLARRLSRWASGRIPELVVVSIGLLLRISLYWWYDVTLSYDYYTHHEYLQYVVKNHALPPWYLNVATYHPPLFYVLGALVESMGFTSQAVGWISRLASCLQLLLMWLGCELYLEESRLARVLALAIATIVPTSLHTAGMITNEALSDFFCTGAAVLLPQVLLQRGRAVLCYGAGAGAFLGLALLTKVSGSMVLASFLLALAMALVRKRDAVRVRAALQGTAAVLVVTFAICGWHYARHKAQTGKFVLTTFDLWVDLDPRYKVPYLDHRVLSYVLGWNDDIFKTPYWPTATKPNPRFWPVLLATTFSDYYNFGFFPVPAPRAPREWVNGRALSPAAKAPATRSMKGGTVLAVLAIIAWLVAARTLWYRGDHPRLLLLFIAFAAVAGQLHFAIKYPMDQMGMIKGSYLQFAEPVYCALSGLAIATLWNRRGVLSRLLALASVAAIAMVASYALLARVLVPLGW